MTKNSEDPVDIGRSLVLGILKGYWEAGSKDHSQITELEWDKQERNGDMTLLAHLQQGGVYRVTAQQLEENDE